MLQRVQQVSAKTIMTWKENGKGAKSKCSVDVHGRVSEGNDARQLNTATLTVGTECPPKAGYPLLPARTWALTGSNLTDYSLGARQATARTRAKTAA